jgi:hypothetical protein
MPRFSLCGLCVSRSSNDDPIEQVLAKNKLFPAILSNEFENCFREALMMHGSNQGIQQQRLQAHRA